MNPLERIQDVMMEDGWSLYFSDRTMTGGHCFGFKKEDCKISVAIEEIDQDF